MGLRRDFLVHKGKTVESFNLVRADISSINNRVDKFSAEISQQNNQNFAIASKIENVGDSIRNVAAALDSFKNKLNDILSKSRLQSLKISSLENAVRKSQKDSKKIRKLLNVKVKLLKKLNLKSEKKIKSQHKRIVQLNKKIEGKKAVRKIVTKRIITRKVKPRRKVIKTITPKKTVTTITTPRRKITKTETPTKKEVVEVFKGRKKSLI